MEIRIADFGLATKVSVAKDVHRDDIAIEEDAADAPPLPLA